jgi:predicted permease
MKQKLREWRRRLLATFRHRDDNETEEELRFHLEMVEQEALRRGEDVRDARLRAGGVAQAAEAVRDQATIRWLTDFLRDSRHGIRLLARTPVFTAAAIVSLSLGIGANTAIFSLIDAVILRSMPVHEPGRLVQFAGGRVLSYPLFRQFREELHGFTDMFAQSSLGRRDVVFDEEPEAVNAEVVSGNYYSMLGIPAFAGRTFDAELDRNPTPVAVISHAYWMRRFALSPDAIGRTFRWNDRVFTIIGVSPPEFQGVVPGTLPEITLPLSMAGQILDDPAWLNSDSMFWLSVMGRLRPGYTIDGARAEVATIYSRVIQAEADRSKGNEFNRRQILAQRMPLEASGNGFDNLRSRFGEPLRLLMGIVALILLIACANLANLLLGRATTRRREIAVRLAIGAGRGRVIRQMLAEGMLLAATAGVLGVLLAWWSANALAVMMSNGGQKIALNLRPDLRILAFAACVSGAACVLFSLAPAIHAARQGIQPTLAEARSARWRWGRGLIAAQVAISGLLVIGAGLFGRTLLRVYAIETGFHREDVALISVKTDRAGLQGHALRGRILESLRSMPGVESASFENAPLSYKGSLYGTQVEGYTYGPNEDVHVQVNYIAEDYFRTLRTPVIMGREFSDRDTTTSPRVVVVNEAFARRYFQGRSPLGKWVQFPKKGGEPDRREIIGMVKDIRPRSLREEVPAIAYVAVAQANRPPTGVYMVRGTGIAGIVDSALKRVDGKLRATDVRTLNENLSRSILQERMLGTLSGLFGTLSLILVSVGVYGVMAFQVARRQKEIGIRMALGAQPLQVTGLVLAETAMPVAAGVAIGVAGALGLTRFAQKMLYGVAPTDPVTFAGASVILILLALLAAYVPSRRAARLSPVETLRFE